MSFYTPIAIIFPFYMPLAIIFGIIAAAVASRKGRNTVGYFLFCFFSTLFFTPVFGLLILIILLMMSNLDEERQRHSQEFAWRRRHHESMEQERAVNKNFREHVIQRLDRQDDALGLPKMEGAPIDAPPAPKEIVQYPMLGDGSWYIVVNGKEQGPVPEEEVVQRLRRREISSQTYLWSEGMKDWMRAYEIGNFSSFC